jgi:hypothetical protein
LPSRRRVSLLAQPPARRRDSAEAEDRGRVLRLHQGHMQQRVRLTPLPQTPARSPEGSRATRHARETPADQKARTLFYDRRLFFFSAGPIRDATPSLVPPSSAHHHATDTTGTRAVSRTTRRRSRRSRNARRAEGARLRPRRCRSRFRSRRRSRRPLRARSAPPVGRARPLTRSPQTRNTRNTSDLPRTRARTHRVVTSRVRSRRRTRPRLRRARTRGPPSPPARRRSRRSRRCRAAPKRARRPRSGSAWRLRSTLLRSTRRSGTIAERIAQTSSGRRTRVSRRTCRVRTSRSARGRRRRRSRARVRPLSGPSPLRARATFAAAPSARPRPRRGGSGTAEHASRDPRDPRSIWGWGRPPRSRGGGWEVCSGGTPRPSSGTRSGRARRAPAPAPARRPCGAAAGSGPYAAASAGSARSTGGRAAGATEGTSLRRRERGIERDAGGGTRKVAIVTKNTTRKQCHRMRVDSRDFTPSVRAATRAAPSSRARAAKSRRRKAQPGAGTRRAGTTAPRGVLPASSDSLFERRGRGASARASPGRRAGGCASSISSRRVP